MRNGDTIPLKNSSAFPTTERVLASIATILRGGGIPNLEMIQTEINNLLTGRADQIREFLNRLDTFTDELNQQRQDITRAIDSTNRLLSIVAQRNDTLDRVLTEFPPLIKHFADTRDLFADAVEALGRISVAADNALAPVERQPAHQPAEPAAAAQAAGPGVAVPDRCAQADAHRAVLDRERAEGGSRRLHQRVADGRPDAVARSTTAFLSGTGVSGMLRALEQAWGRDPATMIPDVRFTPNPHNAPGGPLVERGE